MTAINRNPQSLSLFQSTKFQLTFARLPGVTYFCQIANFPGLSLTEIPRQTPFVDLYIPGEKLIYDTLNITFLVNEDLSSWLEVHDWMRAITFPTRFEEYVSLARQADATRTGPLSSKNKPQYDSATLTYFSNKNNPLLRLQFVDVFPTSLSSIMHSSQDSAENIITADATFRFSYYNYERIT